MSLKTRRRRRSADRAASWQAIAAGWTGGHTCRTGDEGCRHVECSRCGKQEVVEPRRPMPTHDCPGGQVCLEDLVTMLVEDTHATLEAFRDAVEVAMDNDERAARLLGRLSGALQTTVEDFERGR